MIRALLSKLRGRFFSRLALRARLALWSAILLFGTSILLTLFINFVARASLPRVIVAPLIATPPPVVRPTALPEHITPVPFEAPQFSPQPIVKGLAIQQVQQATLRQILLISTGGILLILVVGSLGIYWLSGYGLRPVRELAQWVTHIDAQTLETRFAVNGPNDEIKQLADAFNSLLDRLEESLQQQKRFVSDAAHELRTPLATLRTSIEVVHTNPNATLTDYREMSQKLEKTLSRLERLTENLLLLARAEQQVTFEEVFLWPLVEDVLSDMKPLAQLKDVRLQLDGNTDILVRGDSSLLSSAFRNLIDNAILYNRPGGSVKIHIASESKWAITTIADTGIGIPQEDIASIFDRFYRGREARSLHRNGTGLGLALVDHIVHLHGGEIQVESTLDISSTFTVRLPLKE